MAVKHCIESIVSTIDLELLDWNSILIFNSTSFMGNISTVTPFLYLTTVQSQKLFTLFFKLKMFDGNLRGILFVTFYFCGVEWRFGINCIILELLLGRSDFVIALVLFPFAKKRSYYSLSEI